MSSIWVLDDDKSIRWVFEKALEKAGLEFKTFSNTNEAINQFNYEKPSVILSDIRMPGESGLIFLTKVKEKFPNIPIIIMTAYSDLDTAVASFKKGAFEYIAKPFDIEKVLEVIQKALALNQSEPQPIEFESYPDIIGQAQSMQEIFRIIGKLSQSNATVLINGESGSGKELVANAIHKNSSRKEKPFIAINTAAIPKDLLEAELFGYEKGAFTGANQRQLGRFEQANAGTLFLDEIGDMPVELQTRLLRVLNDGQFYRVGGQELIKVDVRVITATHQNLQHLVKEGKFRDDLFHRLNVIRMNVPPLRERIEDIQSLSQFFLNQSAKKLQTEVKVLAPDVIEFFKTLQWHGNVRQLENVCHWLTVMAAGKVILISDLPAELKNEPIADSSNDIGTWREKLTREIARDLLAGRGDIYDRFVTEVEKVLIEEALKASRNRRIDAAKLLGIGRNTITRKISEFEIK
ncbi:MAG: nitrogen regulation protein NR(I) [Methylophilaceae bacterium]|nr:nitrogen regulation protein NR(I) [Methylophilaceae bacterium]MBL6791207.1 nitrogen regulation protein NR(I) [Methylophilaceae bacterium]